MKLQRKGEFLSTRVQYIPLGRIRPNPQQPRRSFDEDSLSRSWRPASAPAGFCSP